MKEEEEGCSCCFVWPAVVWQKPQSSSDLAAPANRLTNRLIRRNVKIFCSVLAKRCSAEYPLVRIDPSSASELAFTPPAWASFRLQGEFLLGLFLKISFSAQRSENAEKEQNKRVGEGGNKG